MPAITSITHRRVLNSHVDFTTEFLVTLEDGSVGRGASPKGETISIYEDQNRPINPDVIIRQLEADGCFRRPLDQQALDAYLAERFDQFGRNNAFSLSLAFYKATEATQSPFALFARPEGPLQPPPPCLNIKNGGWHAYTNPVLSDFSEFMLVARESDPATVIASHQTIQKAVKERLRSLESTVISGNRVHRFPLADNRAVIESLLSIRDSLGLAGQFDLMIDASASDLWKDDRYRLAITDGSAHTSESFRDYWQGLIRDYGLMYLEDPFHENDEAVWRDLTAAQTSCRIIGDNFYSSDAARITRGAAEGFTHGVIVKPNQAGSVTAVRQAIEAAQRHGQIPITSHRSISTEETFLSLLTCMYGVPYIKIGPLETDYSSVVRLNEIIRLTTEAAGSR